MNNSSYICYMITHEYKSTYVGITNNFTHRLSQHNGIIKGGAKATHKYNDWKLAFYISGFTTKSEVLSFEWHMHHPNGKRRKDSSSKDYYGVCGRIRGLCQVLSFSKFERENINYKCNMKSECIEYIQKYDPDLYILLESMIEITCINTA
jgi:predicted GIY-YIG superfamily endonuclease